MASKNGTLRLRWRWQGRHLARPTGLADTAEQRRRLEPLRELVGKLLAAGEDPTAVLDKYFPTAARVNLAAPIVIPPPIGPTVAAYTKLDWLPLQVPPLVRKAQARDYGRHMNYVLPTLGAVLLAELRPSDVRGLQSDLLLRGLSVKNVKNILSGTFRAMVRSARADGWVTRALFEDLRWPSGTRRSRIHSIPTSATGSSPGFRRSPSP